MGDELSLEDKLKVMKELHETSDVVSISIDTDPNEDEAKVFSFNFTNF